MLKCILLKVFVVVVVFFNKLPFDNLIVTFICYNIKKKYFICIL